MSPEKFKERHYSLPMEQLNGEVNSGFLNVLSVRSLWDRGGEYDKEAFGYMSGVQGEV